MLLSCQKVGFSNGKGNWTINGRPVNEFKGCIDIPLTSFKHTTYKQD